MSIIAAILVLGAIVFFHELGHFLAAKLFGVGVLEFSIGMGPRILSIVFRNTRYSLKLLPLGGSCAMLGEDSAGSGDFLCASGTESGDGILDYEGVRFREAELPRRSFRNRPNWQRFVICIAGVFHNFLLAFLLAIVVCHFSGFDKPIMLGTEAEAPAAGMIQEGDLLRTISYDGKHERRIRSFRDLYIYLYLHSGEFTKDTRVSIGYERAGNAGLGSAVFAPYYDGASGRYRLGISFYSGRVRAANVPELLEDACYELLYNVRVVFDSLQLLVHGRVERNELMGPVGTVSVIGSTVEASSRYGLFNAFLVLLELSVMLSANLGVMNLLPIPALDGGRLLFILLEMLTRRRLDPKIEERINQVGMALLLFLMLLLLSNDIFNVLTGAYKNII